MVTQSRTGESELSIRLYVYLGIILCAKADARQVSNKAEHMTLADKRCTAAFTRYAVLRAASV